MGDTQSRIITQGERGKNPSTDAANTESESKLGDLEMLTHLDHRLALTKHPVSLPQLTNNLLRRVMPSLHIVVLLAHKGNRGLTQSWLRKQGSGH